MALTVFANSMVERHRLFAEVGSTLQEISDKDYPSRYKFNPAIKCLDGDKLVGTSDKSVDTIIGIGDYSNNCTSNKRLLLLELRMDYENRDGLHKSLHEEKITGTKKHLGNDCAIDTNVWFLFDKKFIHQARHKFSSWREQKGNARYFYAYSVEEFNEIVLDEMELQKEYSYLYSAEDIEVNLMSFVESDEWDAFVEKMYYWKNVAEKFVLQNKRREVTPIQQAFCTIWAKVEERRQHIDDDGKIILEIIEEDFKHFL